MAAVTGKITNAITGNPVQGATVMFTDGKGNPLNDYPMQKVTDIAGGFYFDTLGGQYITITHPKFMRSIKAIDWSQFGDGGAYQQHFDIGLVPDAGIIAAVVPYKTTLYIGGAILGIGVFFNLFNRSGNRKKTTRSKQNNNPDRVTRKQLT